MFFVYMKEFTWASEVDNIDDSALPRPVSAAIEVSRGPRTSPTKTRISHTLSPETVNVTISVTKVLICETKHKFVSFYWVFWQIYYELNEIVRNVEFTSPFQFIAT